MSNSMRASVVPVHFLVPWSVEAACFSQCTTVKFQNRTRLYSSLSLPSKRNMTCLSFTCVDVARADRSNCCCGRSGQQLMPRTEQSRRHPHSGQWPDESVTRNEFYLKPGAEKMWRLPFCCCYGVTGNCGPSGVAVNLFEPRYVCCFFVPFIRCVHCFCQIVFTSNADRSRSDKRYRSIRWQQSHGFWLGHD